MLKVRFTALALLASVVACDVAPRNVPQYSIEDFLENTSYGGGDFSSDGSKLLVHHDASGVFNVYAMPVDGSEPVQLTRSSESAHFSVSWFGDDERFLYTADQGGNELNHLYVQDPDGNVTDLTPGENLKAQFNGWSRDRQSFFVATNERDPRFFDLYEYQATAGYPRDMIFRNDEGFFPGGLSDDGRYLTLVEARTTNDNDLYVQDLTTGERMHVTPHEGDVSSSPNDFSRDNRYLYYTTNENGEFNRLLRYNLETAEKEEVVSAEWDVMYGGFSRGGKYLTVGINADARTELRVYDVATMEQITLPAVPGGDVTSVRFSADDEQMAMYASGSRFPSDLFVQSMGGGEPQRLTNSLNENIDSDYLVDATVARFASYDGLEIPGVLYKPHQATVTNKAPALVWVHGGPGGQSRVGYSGLIQYLVNHGYVIYAINNRGSSGYGKSFFALDDRQHGEADLQDVVASKRMLIESDYVDPDKIGIIGGSYGGYMVVAALAFEPEAFEVGVDIFGVTNWLRTLESIPPWWEAQREALYAEMGDPATDRERLERISPLFHASNIVKPLIVLQGANDPRVLQVESDEMVEAVRANGVPVEYIVFPDEGHGFRNKDNQMEGYRAILAFLEEHLKGVATAETSTDQP
jgi:prolyl oligopeptidase